MVDDSSSLGRSPEKAAYVAVLVVVGLGVGASLVYGLQSGTVANYASVTGVALAISGAAFLSGGLLGFLFGIPRSLQHDGSDNPPPSGELASTPGGSPQSATGSKVRVSFHGNSSLEQISDWLTKIIVGVGLTQIGSLPGAILSYADYVAPGLGDFPSAPVFSIAIATNFGVCGFLLVYLWARINLVPAFQRVELDTKLEQLDQRMARVDSRMERWENQRAIDADAIEQVGQYLFTDGDASAIRPGEWDALLNRVSLGARGQISEQVQRALFDGKEDSTRAFLVERTIPIFRSLINSDHTHAQHTVHANLAIALLSLNKPEWRESQTEIGKAIEMRGDWRLQGHTYYEYYRALCRVMLLGETADWEHADKETRHAILADLKAAATDPATAEFIQADPILKEWEKHIRK